MRKILNIVGLVIGVVILAFLIYVSSYSKATDVALNIYTENGSLDFVGENTNVGFIIYPGGKVDEIAYSSLAKLLSDEGYTTVISSFPLNLGFFGSTKANNAIKNYPEIDKWVIIGHSLGGAVASMYIDENDDKIDGLVLLASYPIKDLTDNNIETITIIGSNDTVVNYDALDENKAKLKDTSNALVIDGGNHAGFGDYGDQKGDGENTIGNAKQQSLTVDEILKFIETLE